MSKPRRRRRLTVAVVSGALFGTLIAAGVTLADIQCVCTTMYRIDLKHLYWVLAQLAAGNVVNQISVDRETKRWSRIALDRMLQLRPGQPVSAK